MPILSTFLRSLLTSVVVLLLFGQLSVQASTLDPYVVRFLDVTVPVELPLNDRGDTKAFSAIDLSNGKRLFEDSCKSCHVGGSTLPNPLLPLSLEALHGATPPRDTVSSLVGFLRQPMTYDGSEETEFCRRIPESWLSTEQLEQLSAFVLRAAQKAPGWGTSRF